jgi:hypothetical protein
MQDDEDLTDLIRAAAGGDRRAFEDLVLRKRDQVVRTAFQITGNTLAPTPGRFVCPWASWSG